MKRASLLFPDCARVLEVSFIGHLHERDGFHCSSKTSPIVMPILLSFVQDFLPSHAHYALQIPTVYIVHSWHLSTIINCSYLRVLNCFKWECNRKPSYSCSNIDDFEEKTDGLLQFPDISCCVKTSWVLEYHYCMQLPVQEWVSVPCCCPNFIFLCTIWFACRALGDIINKSCLER